EYPQAEGEPYYPIPCEQNEALYKKYQALANSETRVTFVGRLAEYRYYNMDQVVGAALTAAKRILEG
ncbi:MAG: UDP-galactopyranose mutase, partial [Clostridiales bacterium]|nr:UDP-galactopyranose mutase [Clostridiales bacterium]